MQVISCVISYRRGIKLSKMLVFSGSSNKLLAGKIAKKLKTRLGKIELSRFPNGEAKVYVTEPRVGRQVVVIQSLSDPVDRHLVEFCLICDALKRKGVKEIIAVIPWLGYSLQDKVFRAGEALSTKVVSKMLQVVPLDKVITYDLHNLAIPGFFEAPLINLSGREFFVEYFKNKVDERTVVVSPDAGAAKSSTRFANDLGLNVVYVNKKRDFATGKVTVQGISQKVKGKKVLIKDDLISTGGTLVTISKLLKQQGVQSIEVAATHHLYVEGTQAKLNQSLIGNIVVTDTVEPKVKDKKLKVLSVAEKIAKEIES